LVVNRKDPEGANIFQGGFLGLDNIGVFDRSAPLPTAAISSNPTHQLDGHVLPHMLAIALELAKKIPRTKTLQASSSNISFTSLMR